ncbi:50S ribosomal protein L17 [Draconibacterium halophilum]|uniref:Large ribosomal subunit protein bL17 n=1 Tax=Draconibacterium halophilum TaxID=2706887 RepID=A0A6C0RBU2_9BACT|nr:50S ribosomal protein L17 [Draconibacterium halophilum]
MRHNKKFNHLGRKAPHRKAMLANMASSLIAHKRISTTVAKAKALRMYVEPLITRAKEDTTHSRRVVFSQLQDKDAVSELFREVAVKVADRPGGYTRILKTGSRLGDNADMCIIELVDFNEAMLAAKEEAAAPKKRRSRRGGAKKSTEVAAQAAPLAKAETEVEPKSDEEGAMEKEENAVAAQAAPLPDVEDAPEEPKADESADEEKKEE